MDHERYFYEAVEEAKKATCARRLCGSIVVAVSGEVIGRGWNGPPARDELQRRCDRKGELHTDFKSDKTCCIHAEWRAIFDALRHHPAKIEGAALYFAAVDEEGEHVFAGAPYCTICSKMALDVGLRWFGLWHETGIRMYDTREYNDLSFAWKP
jgi:deoxycytidylate deaminase